MTLDILIEAREALKLSMATLRHHGAISDYMQVLGAEIKLGFQIDKLTSRMAIEVAA